METGPENHKLLVPKSFVKDRVQLPKVGPDPVVSWLRHLADEVLVEIDQQFSGPRGHGLCSAADLQRPSVENWCRKRDSNPRPPLYESGALPAELLRHRAAIVARMSEAKSGNPAFRSASCGLQTASWPRIAREDGRRRPGARPSRLMTPPRGKVPNGTRSR